MQYNVPQFVDVEDKIIGPLTLKQFLTLLVGGIFCFLYWSIFKNSGMFIVLSLVTIGVFGAFAFVKLNGRPLTANIFSIIQFLLSSKTRVFQKIGERAWAMPAKKIQKEEMTKQMEETTESRLNKLAYFLDQKVAEEERLIHSGEIKKKWLNQI